MFKYKNTTPLLLLISLQLLLACQSKENEEPTFEKSADPAINAVSQQIVDAPNDPSLYVARAELFYQNDAFDEAITDLRKAITLDSTELEYHYFLADVYLDYFQSRKALEALDRALEIEPQSISTLLKLSEFQLILKKYEESFKTLDRILNLEPSNAEAYFLLGLNYKEQGDTARAINSFQETIEIDPEILDAWIFLGQLQGAIGNKIALQYFESALLIAPQNIKVMHAKADYFSDQDQLQEALGVYREITRIDPQYEQAFFNMGLLYMDLDSLVKARKQFDILVKVDPLHIRGYFYRGLCSEFLSQPELAEKDYQTALKMAPDYQDALDGIDRLKEVK